MLSVNGPLHVCTHLNNLHFSDVQYTVSGKEELTSEQHTDRTSKYFIFYFSDIYVSHLRILLD